MATTLLDVARLAGVSEATASRVLNGRRYVAVATRERVERAAFDLDYVPHHAARELSTSRTATIALLVHHAQYPAHGEGTFSSRVVDGISRALGAAGHDLLYVPIDDARVGHIGQLPAIGGRRADGLIVLGPAFPRTAVQALAAIGRPMILVDNRFPGTDAVLADNRAGMRALAHHLVAEHGYRRIACFAGPASWPSTAERLAGIRDIVTSAGAELALLRARETTMRDGASLVDRLQVLPDAIMAVNDAMAIGALTRFRVTGRRTVPITGFDDIAWAELTEPALSTVAVDATRLGQEAARRLLARLSAAADQSPAPREIRVAATVRLRRSCGCGGRSETPDATEER